MSRSCKRISEKSNPKLWARLKTNVQKSDKGGPKGKWSARKSQILVKKYVSHGGKFKGSRSKCNSMHKWTREKWDYVSPSSRKTKKGRYLPEVIRKTLTSREKRSENRRKASQRGKWSPYSRSVAKKFKKYNIGSR
jgi:hypothetical protein